MRKEMKKREVALFSAVILIAVFSLNFISAATRNCYGCLNCTAEIGNSSAGDVIQLNRNITNNAGTCIDFNGKDGVIFDCLNFSNAIDGTGSGSGIYLNDVNGGSNTNIIKNCNISNFHYNLNMSYSTNNILTNSSFSSSPQGIWLNLSSGNNFTNVTANSNTADGFRMTLSHNNILRNFTAKNNRNYGIYLQGFNQNNSFFEIITKGNNLSDIYMLTSTSETRDYCSNNFTDITGSEDRMIEYYNYTAIIENKTLSELILCNADNSIVRNITISGSDVTKNNGFYLFNTDGSNISDINSSYNLHGIFLSHANSNNLITNIIADSNYMVGIELRGESNNNTFINLNTSNCSYGIHLDYLSNWNNFSKITANNNSVYGVDISGDNNTFSGIVSNLNVQYAIIINSQADNILLLDILANNNTYGITINRANNSIVRDAIVNYNNRYGIYFFMGGGNNTFENIVANSNSFDGIYLYSGSNNTFRDINVTSNNFSGIRMEEFSHHNNFTNITANWNYYGAYLNLASNNTLTNFSTKWNTANGVNETSGAGIFFNGSDDNKIIYSQIRHNFKEALYFSNSSRNNITNCIIENHSNGGLRFISSTQNIIYNNFMNNSLNYNDTTSLGNYFNITKTQAVNIVGGDYIGGNYWDDMNGTGFSETNCTDADGDDICDSWYNLSDGNYDYLPLALISFALPEEAATTSGSSGGPSSTTETAKVTTASPEEPIIVEISRSGLVVRKITVNVKRNLSEVSLKVSKVGVSEANFDVNLSGYSYQSFKVDIVNITNSDIENAIIEFRVNKTWLAESNFTKEDVVLYRKPTGETNWSSLETKYLYEEDGYYRFSAVSPGFSTFVVFVSTAECIPAEKRCVENEVHFCLGNKKWLVSEVCDYQCKDGECIEKGLQVNLNPLVVYPIIGIVVVGVLISFLAQRMPKMRRTKDLTTSQSYEKFEKRSK